jgi:hypothetical protein
MASSKYSPRLKHGMTTETFGGGTLQGTIAFGQRAHTVLVAHSEMTHCLPDLNHAVCRIRTSQGRWDIINRSSCGR